MPGIYAPSQRYQRRGRYSISSTWMTILALIGVTEVRWELEYFSVSYGTVLLYFRNFLAFTILESISDRVLTARFLCGIRSIQSNSAQYNPGEASKGEIVVVTSDLNAKMGSDNIFGHIMEDHGLVDHINKVERFVDFCNFRRFAIDCTLFKQRTCH